MLSARRDIKNLRARSVYLLVVINTGTPRDGVVCVLDITVKALL